MLKSTVKDSVLWSIAEKIGIAEKLQWVYWQATFLWMRHQYVPTVGGCQVSFRVTTVHEYNRVTSLHGERSVIEHLLEHIEPGDVVWDVGANIGMYACPVAVHGGVDTIVCFEPEDSRRSRLRTNLEQNAETDKWEISPFALGGSEGTGTLVVDNDELGIGTHRISVGNGENRVDIRRGETLILDDGFQSPDILKVDVEGHELAVLEGLADELWDVSYIYCEAHGREDANEIRDLLSEYGFTVTCVNTRGETSHLFGEREA